MALLIRRIKNALNQCFNNCTFRYKTYWSDSNSKNSIQFIQSSTHFFLHYSVYVVGVDFVRGKHLMQYLLEIEAMCTCFFSISIYFFIFSVFFSLLNQFLVSLSLMKTFCHMASHAFRTLSTDIVNFHFRNYCKIVYRLRLTSILTI